MQYLIIPFLVVAVIMVITSILMVRRRKLKLIAETQIRTSNQVEECARDNIFVTSTEMRQIPFTPFSNTQPYYIPPQRNLESLEAPPSYHSAIQSRNTSYQDSIAPPKYQSHLDQTFEQPSMKEALCTSSKLSIPNAVSSSNRIISWDSGKGDSIEFRAHDQSSFVQNMTLSPLDERIEVDSDENSSNGDNSGQWLDGLKKSKKSKNKKFKSQNKKNSPRSSMRLKNTHGHKRTEKKTKTEHSTSSHSKDKYRKEKTSQRESHRKRSSSSFDSGLDFSSQNTNGNSKYNHRRGKENYGFDYQMA